MPWDSVAQADDSAAQREYADRMAGLASQKDFRERYYGLGGGYEDPKSNPYSQAAMLQHQHEAGRRGTMNSAGLQLYSGSTVNALAGVDRNYAIDFNQLKLQLEQERAQWAAEEQEARSNRESAAEAASAGAIQRAAETEPEPAPLGGPAKPKAKKGKKGKK